MKMLYERPEANVVDFLSMERIALLESEQDIGEYSLGVPQISGGYNQDRTP